MSAETAADIYTRLLIEVESSMECTVTASQALEFRREQYGLTASAFASVLGLTQPHYSEIVHGLRDVPKRAILRAIAIGVPALPLLLPRAATQEPTK